LWSILFLRFYPEKFSSAHTSGEIEQSRQSGSDLNVINLPAEPGSETSKDL
jgi:hypothetical protein